MVWEALGLTRQLQIVTVCDGQRKIEKGKEKGEEREWEVGVRVGGEGERESGRKREQRGDREKERVTQRERVCHTPLL